MPQFTDGVIERLFGVEDAENEEPERLKQYFFRNKAYESVIENLPIRIVVGHKGVGKSALLKVAYLEDERRNTMAVWIKPSDIVRYMTHSEPDLNRMCCDPVVSSS